MTQPNDNDETSAGIEKVTPETDEPAAPSAGRAARDVEISPAEPSKIDAAANEASNAELEPARKAAPIEVERGDADSGLKPARFALLAASVATAAVIGSIVGAVAGIALTRPAPRPEPAPTLAANAVKSISAEIASLKAAIENANKVTGAQFARIGERIERAEKAQAEPATKIARLAEAVDRLERKSAGPEVTGSIAAKQDRREDQLPIAQGWILRDIFGGRALVEARRYGLFEVGPGANLPELGKVESIRRRDGRWVVLTERGMIVAAR
jgi:hypothetical protein